MILSITHIIKNVILKKLLVVIIIFLMLGVVGFFWWENGLLPENANNKSEQIFVVKNNENVRDIGYQLKRSNLIRDPIVFFLLIKELGLDGKIQAGDFRLSSSMTTSQIAQNLTHGILDIWVTFPEGKRSEEIADILKSKIPTFSDSWRSAMDANEGFLFPDTYLVPRNADKDFILRLLKNNFESKYSSVDDVSLHGLTKTQVVTVASLIEREVKTTQDRPIVASIIYNRLQLGMALQIDATVQYALGYQPKESNWWKENLTVQDIKIDSPFNTYANTGLPPTPICNPGLSSLQAALHPATTDYLYYISDKNGQLHFAKTLEEHNANIRKYAL